MFDAIVNGYFDLLSDTTAVSGHLVCVNSQDLKPLMPQETITLLVAALSLFRQVLYTVNLDDQLQG